MDILALIAAFGGGIIGAYMGALPAFIMTGIYALVGGVLTAAGVGGDVAVNYLAFGSFVGPHIAFAGGVAAAGYAGRKGKLASGTDILSSLNGLGEPDVLLVGGIFGVLGFLIHYCIGLLPVIGSAGPATTDLPGITVFILAVVTRLAFGKTGLTGKYTGSGKREWFATGKGLSVWARSSLSAVVKGFSALKSRSQRPISTSTATVNAPQSMSCQPCPGARPVKLAGRRI